MKINKKQKLDEQNQTPIKISPSKYKLLLLYDLHIRLVKALHPAMKYEMPIFFEGLSVVKRNMEAGNSIPLIDFPALPGIENKTLIEIFADIERALDLETQDEKLIGTCLKCVLTLMFLKRDHEMTMTDDEFVRYVIMEDYVKARSFEALGYWTAKVKKKRSHLIQETKQQQEEIKEQFVTESWIKMIKNSADKKILKDLPKNKIADLIRKEALPLLINKKTKTGVLVLKPELDKDGKPELDKDGNIKYYRGLSRDTIIRIMQKTESGKFKTNPIKK